VALPLLWDVVVVVLGCNHHWWVMLPWEWSCCWVGMVLSLVYGIIAGGVKLWLEVVSLLVGARANVRQRCYYFWVVASLGVASPGVASLGVASLQEFCHNLVVVLLMGGW
jgi:hypothetical protein